ncbi:discoidin domain-containing protein [Planctomycetota bacterium]
MTRKTQYFIIFALFFGMAVPCGWAQENQIVNSEFDDGLDPWMMYNYQNTAEGFTIQVVKDAELSGRNALEIDIFDAPAVTAIGIATSGMVLEPGNSYPIGFTAKAEEARGMRILLQGNINNAKWPTYTNTTVDLTTEPQDYVIDYTYTGGDTIGDDDTEAVTLYLIIKWAFAKPEGYDLNSKVWIDRIYFGAEPPLPAYPKAGDLYPVNEADDVFRDVVLEWAAGDNADTHNLYFGEVAEDVNAADTGSDLLLSSGKTDTSYDVGILEYGETYYWRVDEVNGVTVEKGDVWSFTIEPYSIPVAAVTASASTQDTNDVGPENTINSSGLDPNDHHSTDPNTMWFSEEGDPDPWIQFDFDKLYKIDAMQVWNANTEIELIPFLSQGVKDVTIEISTDGEVWTALEGAHQFARGEGVDTYAANTTIDFGGAQAQSVKINIDSGWGSAAQYGLSEVRFLTIPTYAREPMPMDQGSGGKDLDVELAWRPGREADIHEIYLGMEANDLGLLDTSDSAGYVAESLDSV